MNNVKYYLKYNNQYWKKEFSFYGDKLKVNYSLTNQKSPYSLEDCLVMLDYINKHSTNKNTKIEIYEE